MLFLDLNIMKKIIIKRRPTLNTLRPKSSRLRTKKVWISISISLRSTILYMTRDTPIKVYTKEEINIREEVVIREVIKIMLG